MCCSSWISTLVHTGLVLALLPYGFAFEWTALGDSYASGVGAGTYLGGQRCLRYDEAYPVEVNSSRSLPGLTKFNNNVCSGATIGDVLAYQLEDGPTKHQPRWDYGSRPGFGTPQTAVLHVGGDDIDFPGIVFNCILDWSLPLGGPPTRTCPDQISVSWTLLTDPALEINLVNAIQQIVTKGRSKVGDSFQLIVLSYAQFFNELDPGCNNVTFARNANPKPDGKDHTLLTVQLRATLNSMSLHLNGVIQNAVAQTASLGVSYIDIEANGALDGHRFCEPGIKEPDQGNLQLWFYHYPYDQPTDSEFAGAIAEAEKQVFGNWTPTQLQSLYPNTTALIDAQYAALLNARGLQNETDTSGDGDLWSWDKTVGQRAKVFHPQIALHAHMRDLVLQQMGFLASSATPSPTPPPSTTMTTTTAMSTSSAPPMVSCPAEFSDCSACPNGVDASRCIFDGTWNVCVCSAPCGGSACAWYT